MGEDLGNIFEIIFGIIVVIIVFYILFVVLLPAFCTALRAASPSGAILPFC